MSGGDPVALPAGTPRVLLSFDIDGTLESGDPPGPLPARALRRAQTLGYVIGTSSDRTLREQQTMWTELGLAADFISRKHEMVAIRMRFACDRYLHIGDSAHDLECAAKAGFEFVFVDDLVRAPWPWLAPANEKESGDE